MVIPKEDFKILKEELEGKNITLVAVSKMKSIEDILKIYEYGHRDFGENYVQELADKQKQLPQDIRWHFIGHLQSNKVKYIASFVHLIHAVDSLKLLREIDKQAVKHKRVIDVLLQMHIATEETKFGLDHSEVNEVVHSLDRQPLASVRIRGLMGMATFTENELQLKQEFSYLRSLFLELQQKEVFQGDPILSMGMSSDYATAIEEGSTMVRIGSMLFGSRS